MPRMRAVVLRLALLAAGLLGWTLVGAAPSQPLKRHFIVLVRASSDMGHKDSARLPSILRDALFDRTYGDRFVFDPANDVMSLAFYSLSAESSGTPGACKGSADAGAPGESSGNVLAARYLFDWTKIDWSPLTRDDFISGLSEQLEKKCRFVEERAPEVITWALALADIDKRLARSDSAGRRFDQVVVVDVGIEASFGATSKELEDYRHRYSTQEVDQAERDSRSVQKYFHLGDSRMLVQTTGDHGRFVTLPPGPEQARYLRSVGRQGAGDYPIYLYFLPVEPQRPLPDQLIDPVSKVSLEPAAVSSSEIQALVRPSGPVVRRDDAWRLRQIGWSADGLKAPDGGPLIGRSFDVARCEPPTCDSSSGQPTFPLWGGFGLPARLDAKHSHLTSGRVAFNAVFDYSTGGIYDRLIYRTKPHIIDVEARTDPIVPGALLLPAWTVDSRELTSRWHEGDHPLTLDKAIERVQGSRDVLTKIVAGGLILLAVMGSALFWFLLPGREFLPTFQWRPASDPTEIDFNDTGNDVVLLGTLQLINTGIPGPVSALLRKVEQPRRELLLEVGARGFAGSGFTIRGEAEHPVVIGLARNGARSERSAGGAAGALSLRWQGNVSHGQEFLVFLGRDRIVDFSGDADSGRASVKLQVPLTAHWRRRWSTRFDRRVESTIDLRIVATPKEPSLPVVSYRSPDSKVYYPPGVRGSSSHAELGAYVFKSSEKLRFAKSFEDRFKLAAQVAGESVGSDWVALQSELVHLSPGAELVNPVLAHCAAGRVANPDPPSHLIAFHCLGPAGAGSDLALQKVQLFRDRTQAGLDLTVNPNWPEEREVYWGPDGVLRWRPGGVDAPTESIAAEGRIVLEAWPVKFKRGAEAAHTVMSLEFGNTAHNGKGRVEVDVRARLHLGEHYRDAVRDPDDRPVDAGSLIEVSEGMRGGSAEVRVSIAEGERARTLDVSFQTLPVYDIVDGRIPPDQASVAVEIIASIWSDAEVLAGSKTPGVVRRCTLEVPVEIELLPADTWLCIDFGTSAITVARKEASLGRLVPTDLQKANQNPPGRDVLNFAIYDPANAEAGTRFLPSAVVFDADLRRNATSSRGHPGFPDYAPGDCMPGQSSFVSLPAKSSPSEDRTGRIVHSLKSWFAAGSERILLDAPVGVRAAGSDAITMTRVLQTRDAIGSTLGALAEAYIRPDGEDAGRVVLTHPNTLTSVHVSQFLDIARKSLAPRLRIPLEERIGVVSESDAVAYFYVDQIRANPPAVDNLLVYDFGAGTLDVSVVRVESEWTPEPRPKRWRTLARLGVPLAGNRIDKLIARVAHQVLSDPAQTDQVVWDYQYPIVGKSEVRPELPYHREAIREVLWPSIRAAKHRSSRGQARFEEPEFVIPLIGLGRRAERVLVAARADRGIVADPAKQGVRLEKIGDNLNPMTVIAIPAKTLFDDPAMSRFHHFVTHEVVHEALQVAGLSAEAVTSVVVSGRGALWPGLRQAVWNQFPNAAKPDLMERGSSERMKHAVAEGAIEFQRMSRTGQLERDDSSARPRLVVSLMKDQKYRVLDESQWQDQWIDVAGVHRGGIFQVAHSQPSAQDQSGYRRHFYTRVPRTQELFEDAYAERGRIHLKRTDTPDGGYLITAENGQRGGTRKFGGSFSHLDREAHRPDWPVGEFLISPEDVD